MPRWTNSTLYAIVGLVAVAVIVGLFYRQVTQPSPPPAARAPAAMDHHDWHLVDATNEVRWYGGSGQCYARARDGSTRASDGSPGQVPVAEKFCIVAGAKDTPFGIPDQR